MAQVAQVVTTRNTSISGCGERSKSRNWSFTLNNYMEAEIKNLCDGKYEYIFQEETGKEGTPHLQGTILLPQPQALSYMKKINGRAHWEITRNKFASIQYCVKGETRSGKIYSNMNIPEIFGTVGTAQNEELKKFKNDFENWKKDMIENSIKELIENDKLDWNKICPLGMP